MNPLLIVIPLNFHQQASTLTITMLQSLYFFGNLLIISCMATRNRLKRICDQYIASLAFAHFLVSVFVLPFAMIRQNLGYWPFESTMVYSCVCLLY
uniref:G_PROTEIN_RECEP_F1_2 domain-containing protein n=1 Tax=Schistosoma mansoni TaxID=6183 RepID=A0A5K4F8S9_SCHMA